MNRTKYPNLLEDALAFLDRHELGPYEVAEEILQILQKKYPHHDVPDAVVAKAKLLNLFYSTGIQAISAMTRNILRIQNIDEILAQPKYSAKLVNAISHLELKGDVVRNNYSFATKYCALHEPEKYPIYDSIVAAVLSKLMVQDMLPPFVYNKKTRATSSDTYMTKCEFEEKLRDYDFFVKVYDCFMETYGLKGHLTYRQVDWYIWGSFKENGKRSKIEKIAPISEKYYVEYTPEGSHDKYTLK